MLLQILLGLLGFAGIIYGAELTINGSKAAARKLGISEFFIGLTVLSIGTSLPEIFTHIISATRILFEPENALTLAGIAVGTDIGSNIIQITLIAGVAGLVSTIYTTREFMKQDYMFMLFGIVLLWLMMLDHFIGRIEAAVLIGLYLLYLLKLGNTEHLMKKMNDNNHSSHKKHYGWDIVHMALGLGVLLFCANLVLDSATFFADFFQISGSLIGGLIIGVVTALPEFTTAVTALLKKSSGLSLGTLVGSNITNPLFALGIGAAISTYQIDDIIIWTYFPFWFFASLLGFFFFWRGLKIYNWEAIVMILLYPAFIVLTLYL